MYFMACDKTGTTTKTSNCTEPYLEIKSITPNPYQGTGNLHVTVKAGCSSTGSVDVRLDIYLLLNNGDTCWTGYRQSKTVNNDDTSTFVLDPHSFVITPPSCCSGCSLTGRSYRTRAYANIDGNEKYYNSSFYWGETLPTINVNLGTYRMYSTTLSECTDALNCVSNSFNNSNLDSNNVHISPNYSSFQGVSDNSFVGVQTRAQLDTACNGYAVRHNWTSDTFRVYYALDNPFPIYPNYPQGILGISGNTGYDLGGGYHDSLNWSFVFMNAIDRLSHPNWVLQSVYNNVSVHELIHQLGRDTSSHYIHSGDFADRCAYWPIDHFDTSGDIRELTNFYRICSGTHVQHMRDNLLGTLIASGKSNNIILPFPIHQPSDKYSITMSLAKKIYKKFEPVIAKFELINKDDEPLNISEMFVSVSSQSIIKIKDDMGNQWSANQTPSKFDFIALQPDYVVQPGDTFLASMSINNWGEAFRPWYFDQFGYFPPGRKYDATFYNGKLVSNEVEFEVEDLTEEDETFINTYKLGFDSAAASIAVSKYPDNPFTEYVRAVLIAHSHWKIINKEYNYKGTGLIADYRNFFDEYPNSYYMYDDGFMAALYFKFFAGKDDYSKILPKIKSEIRNSQLNRFLCSAGIEDRIKTVIKRFERKPKKKH